MVQPCHRVTASLAIAIIAASTTIHLAQCFTIRPAPLQQPSLFLSSPTTTNKRARTTRVGLSQTFKTKETDTANVELSNSNSTTIDSSSTTTIDDEKVNKNDTSLPIIPTEEVNYKPILALSWVVALLSALDRVAMSVAIVPISTQYHLSDVTKGEIASFFSVGYGLGIIPAGLILAVGSPTLIMALGVGLWSAATFGTPIAASLITMMESTTGTAAAAGTDVAAAAATSAEITYLAQNLTPLLCIRAVMGAAESVVIPTIQKVLANWVPPSKKSFSVAIIFSGFQCGTVLAYLLSPWVMDQCGNWEGLFYVYGLVGLLWLVPWVLFARDRPENMDNLALVDGSETTTKTTTSVVTTSDNVEVIVDNDKSTTIKESTTTSSPMMNLVELMETDTTTTTTSSSSSSPNQQEEDTSASSSSSSSTGDEFNEALNVLKTAPWKDMFTSKAIWGMTLAHAANNWGLYNSLSWTPTFYAEQYGLNVKESAFLSVLPSIAGAACGLFAGYAADKLISNTSFTFFGDGDGGTTTTTTNEDGTITTKTTNMDEEERRTLVRRVFQATALWGPAACLLTLSSHIPSDPLAAQALLTGTVGLQAFNAAGYGAAAQEKAGERWSGLLYSITSLPGVFFGSLGVYCTGQILELTGQDWSRVFAINGGIDILGGLAFVLLYNSRKELD